MSDRPTMPARIWATGNDHTGCWNVRDVQTCPGVEYIRADAALALVAAEREACADIASENAAATVKAAAIRAKTPSDALAAVEARDKMVRNEALREAAKIAGEAWTWPNSQCSAIPCQEAILALIEGDQTDE